MITTKNLTILRQNIPVLQDISCHIKEGHCVALMGLNGSGKSTFLKTLLGLHLDYQGHFFLKSDAEISYLPEKFALQGDLTGKAYLDFFKGPYQNLRDAFDLPEKDLHKKIKTYSKGMLQKIGLIQFFATQAPLKIADEMMSGLDFKTREITQSFLKQQQKDGTTFLFTTHTLQDAKECADTLLYIDNKHLIFTGAPKDFIYRPSKRA